MDTRISKAQPNDVTCSNVVLGGVSYKATSIVDSAPNKGQDALYIKDEFCGVADGATPLFGEPGSMVVDFANAALQSLYNHRHLSMENAFRQSISKLARRQRSSITCSIAVLAECPGKVSLSAVALGDCAVIAELPNGSISTTTDHRLSELDSGVINLIAKRMKDGATFEDAFASVHDVLQTNRRSCNSPNGYWTFGNDPAAADHLQQAFFPEGVSAALICSDGFMRLLDTFQVTASEEDLLQMAKRHGLNHLLSTLRDLERREGSMNQFPRLGMSDDATAILLTRNHI